MSQDDLARVIGHMFRRPELRHEALTHPSAISSDFRRGRRGTKPSHRGYERLEFLGDRVLGLVIADLLWQRFESEPEGHLTRRLAHLVCRDALARVAKAIGLSSHLVVSRAEAAAGASDNPNILADVCEALIAAIYLDGGFDAASAFVRRFWTPLIKEMDGPPRDPKTALQEWAQGRGLALPAYKQIGREGSEHEPVFLVEVKVGTLTPAQGRGLTKREAESAAASLMLEQLSKS